MGVVRLVLLGSSGTLSGLHHSISRLCPTTRIPVLSTFITLNIKMQCTVTSLPAWYMVRDKRLVVTRPISEPLRPVCDHRCLYHSLCCLDLRPPVGYVFE
jgi:hypothetical protein